MSQGVNEGVNYLKEFERRKSEILKRIKDNEGQFDKLSEEDKACIKEENMYLEGAVGELIFIADCYHRKVPLTAASGAINIYGEER